MDGIIAYILSKKYTNDTVIGMGAIKGAACQVQSINKVNKTTTITLEWEDNLGTSHTQSFDIEDGLDGVSVTGATIKPDGHLELTLSNGNSIDCGQVLPQYDTMPTPSASNEGQILQYIGTTTSSYTNGYFYQCINDGGIYKWVEKLVQDSYTKIQIGDLSDLPDNTKNVVENIVDINSKLDDKENIFRYNVIPTADVSISGAIIQYLGATNATYTNGYYYQCVESPVGSGTYVWVQKNVQPNNGGGGGDGVVDGYYNSLDQLFYEDSAFLNPITGEDNTIYVDLNTNGLYRYNGTIFIKVSSSAESIQVDTMPTADASQLNKIYQYVGTTDINYTNGYFYKCILDGANYKWQVIPTQDSYTKAEIGALSDLPDPSKTVTQNIDLLQGSMSTLQGSVLNIKNDVTNLQGSVLNIQTDVSALQGSMAGIDKTKLDNLAPIYLIGSGLTLDTTVGSPTYGKLQATGMSIPVDDKLDASSLNPVQNKVITLTIDQLQGSVLNKIQKMIGAQEDNFAIIDNNGGVKDSGISKDIVPVSASVSNKLLVASDLSVKADKVSGATNNDIALLDGTGNLKDSTKKLSDLQDKLSEGDGIDIDANNKISLKVDYLTASRVGYIPATEKGSNGGVATLDNAGKVPSSQLPSYVDDVIEGYLYNGAFYTDSAHTDLITPESGKIYVDLHTNTTYRWGGSAYVQISESLALGETSTTAYYGDKGKLAYAHSQITDGRNPHNTTADNVNLKVPISALSGSKLDVESTLYGINTALGTKADKVASAVSGHLAGLDGNGNLTDSGVVANNVIEKVTTATGLLKDDGSVDTTTYAPSNKAYLTDDTAETTIDDTDYFPFYDTSATGKRKTLFSSIVNKLKTTFATLVTGTFTSGNLVSLDSSGNIADSGKKASDFVGTSDIYKSIKVNNTGSIGSTAKYIKIENAYPTSLVNALVYNISAGYGDSEILTLSTKQDNTRQTPVLNLITRTNIARLSELKYDTNGDIYIRIDAYTTATVTQIAGATIASFSVSLIDVSNLPLTVTDGIIINSVNKIDKVSTAIQNDIAIFDANGGVADSNVLISSLPTIAPTPSSGLTESDIVDAVNSATATNANTPSLYGVQQYSNEKTVRRVLNGANIPSGTSMTATGIGTWFDGDISTIVPSTDEADWWYDSAFIVPVYYVLTSDTSIVTGKTYYTRSGTAPNYTYTVVASPVVADIGTYYEQYSDDVDISIKFDPSGDTATLGGYIFDSTTGKICIKFGNSITVDTARIAVDITYTRNEVG